VEVIHELRGVLARNAREEERFTFV